MKPKTIIFLMVVFACLMLYGFYAVEKEVGPDFAISVDMAKPLAIEWPCEVSIVGDNGEKGLRIAPKIGRGWRGEAGGKASYRFFIPAGGRYCIWAYSMWFDECSNAIFAQIDDKDKAIIGNDPVYNTWHWVRGYDIDLGKGTHNLVLSNHSDHISLQKILFSNSASVSPQQTGLVFSDIFYDGFDGCDQGNFTNWKQISGSWLVQNPDSQTCLVENALIGKSQERAFITLQNSDWQDYSLDISIKILPFDLQDCAVGICFGLADPNNFYQIKIQPVCNENIAKIKIINNNSVIMSESKCVFKIDKWQQMHVALREGCIECNMADSRQISIKTDHKITGGIGFLLEGNITVYFDNIHVQQIIKDQ